MQSRKLHILFIYGLNLIPDLCCFADRCTVHFMTSVTVFELFPDGNRPSPLTPHTCRVCAKNTELALKVTVTDKQDRSIKRDNIQFPFDLFIVLQHKEDYGRR